MIASIVGSMSFQDSITKINNQIKDCFDYLIKYFCTINLFCNFVHHLVLPVTFLTKIILN